MSNLTLFSQYKEGEEAINNNNAHANKLRQAIDDFKAGKKTDENLTIIKQEMKYFQPILFDLQGRLERGCLKNWLWAFKDAASIVENMGSDVKGVSPPSVPSPNSKTPDTQNHSAFRYPGS
ncbi:MAG: hypothetical protein M1561_03925 [Gammaproteobacteria bacterium]|nr:hypothetical protein [Gammaproteobacteria bacterium]